MQTRGLYGPGDVSHGGVPGWWADQFQSLTFLVERLQAAVEIAALDTEVAAAVAAEAAARAAADALLAEAAKAAFAPVAADAVRYVSKTGSDANAGLSWGKAFLTAAAAIASLPADGGTVWVGAGVFGTITIPDHVVIRGAGQNVTFFSGTGGVIVTMSGGGVYSGCLMDCTVLESNAAGNTATIGVSLSTGANYWSLQNVSVLGSVALGDPNYKGIGVKADFALKGCFINCRIQFWNEGYHQTNDGGANTFVACNVRQNNTGLRSAPTGGGIRILGGVLEGNRKCVDMAAGRLESLGVHYEAAINNVGFININLTGTATYSGHANSFYECATNSDIVIAADNAQAHSSFGELMNKGLTHNGTGTFTIHDPQVTVALAGTGKVLVHSGAGTTGTNMSAVSQPSSGFSVTSFAQAVTSTASFTAPGLNASGANAVMYAIDGAIRARMQAIGSGSVNVGSETSHPVNLVAGTTPVLRGVVDASVADTQTALLIRRNVGGTFSLVVVSMGAADSGGAGFKVLRVPNG